VLNSANRTMTLALILKASVLFLISFAAIAVNKLAKSKINMAMAISHHLTGCSTNMPIPMVIAIIPHKLNT